VLSYAYEKDPYPVPGDLAEAAAILRRAATLRRRSLGDVP
jgi:hypothetical protein